MNQATQLLGTLAKIALDGTTYLTPTAGTVSKTNCPDNAAADAAGNIWFDLGIIEECQEKVDSTKIPIFRPSPGILQLDDELETKLKRTLQIKCSECSNIMWLLLRRALLPTSPRTGAMGQFVPLTISRVKCWSKFQKYSGIDNSLIDYEQIWSKIAIDNAVTYGGDKQVMFDLTVMQLWSPLNSAAGN